MSASCSHLDDFLSEKGSDSYKLIHSFFVSCIAKGSRKRKANDCYCNVCCGRKRICACLDCAYFGCFPNHIRTHFEEMQHILAVELSYGAVYCFKCSDYMYHSELMSIAKRNKLIEAQIYGTYLYSPWQPTSKEMKLVKRLTGGHSKISAHTFSGLRGILNLGNTCYLSCIVQVLVHTPLLRDYFLGDKHVCKLSPDSECMVCEMYSVFKKFYSGQKCEMVLEKLLFLVFKTAPGFADVRQHDAQEFFVKLIDVMCMHSRGISEPSDKCSNLNLLHCDCIFHKTFSSHIWEDTVCNDCSTFQNSHLEESSFCLSLNLGPEGINDGNEKTVEMCLKKFTSKQLGEFTKDCIQCNEAKMMYTQRSIRRLPIVACLHLDRKSHIVKNCAKTDTVSATFVKNNEFVKFNDCIDLSPFVSCFCCKRVSEPAYDILEKYDKRFSLYAVVSHLGDEESGHYVTYTKLSENEWYIFDDEKIRKVESSEVFNAIGNILFYHKKILDYDVDIP